MKTTSIRKWLTTVSILVAMFGHPNNAVAADSDFGIGISVGAVTGSGIDVVKYFDDYFVHGSGMFIYDADSGSFLDFALVGGKYLHREKILSFGLPVGFKTFAGLNYTDDDRLHAAFGYGVELFSPRETGLSYWLNFSYGTAAPDEEFAFYVATGLLYNFQ